MINLVNAAVEVYVNGLWLVLACLVAYVFYRTIKYKEKKDDTYYLLLGVAVAWSGDLVSRAYWFPWYFLDFADYGINKIEFYERYMSISLAGVVALISIIAGLLHLRLTPFNYYYVLCIPLLPVLLGLWTRV